MANTEDYMVNFFRPRSEHARANMKLIIILAIIWFVGVFGFQAMLMILNKPVPEPNYTVFQSTWPEVSRGGGASQAVHTQFSRVMLSVLGKNTSVKDADKAVVKEALSMSIYSLLPEAERAVMLKAPDAAAVAAAERVLGLKTTGFDKIMIDLLPFSLVPVSSGQLSLESRERLPEIIQLYLVHNRNALTDITFMGFPFHYWYTAQFLLIMFVLLCLIYAVITDRSNAKHNFVEEN